MASVGTNEAITKRNSSQIVGAYVCLFFTLCKSYPARLLGVRQWGKKMKRNLLRRETARTEPGGGNTEDEAGAFRPPVAEVVGTARKKRDRNVVALSAVVVPDPKHFQIYARLSTECVTEGKELSKCIKRQREREGGYLPLFASRQTAAREASAISNAKVREPSTKAIAKRRGESVPRTITAKHCEL